ncbi:MAG: CoA-binding protein [Acidobacteriota bacterium]
MTSRTIAVVGASRDRRKFGNKCVRAYLEAGYAVYPVNLSEKTIEGLVVSRSLSELPVEPDRISLYLQPAETEKLLHELSRFPNSDVWFNPGCADAAILERARQLGIRVRAGCSIVDIGLSPSQFS